MLQTAREFRAVLGRPIKKVPSLRGVTCCNLFFENSTRTRLSFELAEKRLSADVVNFSASGSSVSKGETLKDTARNIEAMKVDLAVIRHRSAGAAHFLTRCIDGVVVNAGDGQHEHPTQALLDALDHLERSPCRALHLGAFDFRGLNVTILGDIAHSRVARSNAYGLTALGARVTLCGPRTMMPAGLIEAMGERDVTVTDRLDEALDGCDVAMALRIQLERQSDGIALTPSLREYHTLYGIRPEHLDQNPDLWVMHPGPVNRGVELAGEGRGLRPLGDLGPSHERGRRADGRPLPLDRRRRPHRRRGRVVSAARIVLLAAVAGAAVAGAACAQPDVAPVVEPVQRTIALTVDDLPVARNPPLAEQERITRDLVGAITAAGVPATGFVNESRLDVDGEREARADLLRQWVEAGLGPGQPHLLPPVAVHDAARRVPGRGRARRHGHEPAARGPGRLGALFSGTRTSTPARTSPRSGRSSAGSPARATPSPRSRTTTTSTSTPSPTTAPPETPRSAPESPTPTSRTWTRRPATTKRSAARSSTARSPTSC